LPFHFRAGEGKNETEMPWSKRDPVLGNRGSRDLAFFPPVIDWPAAEWFGWVEGSREAEREAYPVPMRVT